MTRRPRSYGSLGVALVSMALAAAGVGSGCSGDSPAGSPDACTLHADCAAGSVCCEGTCTTAALCECVTDDECGAQPDSGATGDYICCGSLGDGGPPTGRCARPRDCSGAVCPPGAGCAVPGGVCAGTHRICEAVTSGGSIIDCTCQCQRGAAGAECDATGGCAAPETCNTATCACECDQAAGAQCDAFGGCGAGEACNLDRCVCETGTDASTADSGRDGAPNPPDDGGDSTRDSGATDVNAPDSRASDATSSPDVAADAGGPDGPLPSDAAADDSGGNDGAADATAPADARSTDDASAPPDGGGGGPGSACTGDSDCNDVCVTGNGSPPQTHVYAQICHNDVCIRGARVETCDAACSGNRVVSRTCVAGTCQPDETIEDCSEKLYEGEAGCYTCEEKNPARCELAPVNGGWAPWVPSTAADDPVKNGQCSPDKRQWHTHYCTNPPASCGGIWCYWTTGAPGGPSSETEPEFRCGPPLAPEGGAP